MRIKILNRSFDSNDVPIAVVLTAREKRQIYEASQDSLIHKRNEPMVFLKAPSDIPPSVGAAWMVEAVTEFNIKEVLNLSQRGKKK